MTDVQEIVSKIQTKEPLELWRLSKQAQLQIIGEMSFVRIMAFATACQGFKTGGKPGDRKCGQLAKYAYKNLKGAKRTYCWQHLRLEGLDGPNGERARVEGWLKRHGYIQ